MNISSNCSTSNKKDCESKEENLNSVDNSNSSKNKSLHSDYIRQNLNAFEKFLLSKKNDIISYYYETFKNLLNSEEFLKIFSIKKTSRNFVRKTIMNSFYRNELGDNYYNGNYLNYNYKHINKHIFSNKNSFNDSKQRNIFRPGNNSIINIGKNGPKKLPNNVHNNNSNEGKDDYSSDKCQNISASSVHNIPKNILNNKLDYPPFIPSNHPKKDKEEFIRKKSEDSLSKDKESDSTSAFSEKREDEAENKKEKKEEDDTGEYLLEMFGRKGWICKLCNNFNYETRVKCNRCGILKKPKKLIEIKQRNAEERDKDGDWSCIYCKNLNYSFRSVCNRCGIPKIPYIYNSNLLMNQLNFSMMQSPCFFSINNGKK
jgi:hypothetical protein